MIYKKKTCRIEGAGARTSYVSARTYGGLILATGHDRSDYRLVRNDSGETVKNWHPIRDEDQNNLILMTIYSGRQ